VPCPPLYTPPPLSGAVSTTPAPAVRPLSRTKATLPKMVYDDATLKGLLELLKIDQAACHKAREVVNAHHQRTDFTPRPLPGLRHVTFAYSKSRIAVGSYSDPTGSSAKAASDSTSVDTLAHGILRLAQDGHASARSFCTALLNQHGFAGSTTANGATLPARAATPAEKRSQSRTDAPKGELIDIHALVAKEGKTHSEKDHARLKALLEHSSSKVLAEHKVRARFAGWCRVLATGAWRAGFDSHRPACHCSLALPQVF